MTKKADYSAAAAFVAEVRPDLNPSLRKALAGRIVKLLSDADAPDRHAHDGPPSVYHYQQGCRHPECRAANSEYYKNFRRAKQEEPAGGAQTARPRRRRIRR